MRALVVMSALGLVCAQSVMAQQLPGFLNSNDNQQNLPLPNLPADAYRPSSVDMKLPEPAADSPQQALLMSTPVEVRGIGIEGGTVYSLEELAAVYQPLIGRSVKLADLIKATRKITQRYQADGYLLSYAYLPPQDFTQGQIRVVLVEGYVKDSELRGDLGSVASYVEQLMAKIEAERPLTRKTFERYTTLMSMIPGVTLQAQVPPPGTTDGASHLIASASRKPFTSSLNLSDSSRDELQAVVSASSNSQTSFAEQVTLSALFPPGEDDERYYRLDYSQFIGTEGTQLSLFGSTYSSEPSERIDLGNGIELRNKRDNQRVSVGLSHPWIASPNHWLGTTARVYAVDDKTEFDVVGYPLSFESNTEMRALALEADWRQADESQLRILSGGLYQGIDSWGAETDNPLIDLDFFRLRVSGVQSDKYTVALQGVVSAALYWSDDSLPDAEQAVFGGQNFARGYPGDQASGDKGWGASYELNYSFTRDSNWLRLLQPYAVVDAARTRFNASQLPESKLSSAALGLRFGDARYYNVSLEVAKPMSDIALDSRSRDPRINLSFSYQL
ncbi:MAG: hypothetical protein CMK71_01680 [Pseudomonadaceae bacterium]|nr:hypothetical protein [Pseudomonadaceae bacterium]